MKKRGSKSAAGWPQSQEFRAIAREAAARARAEINSRPRCGAKRKRDGEPCQRAIVRGRTRCDIHGGKTPKGPRGWHVVQMPDGSGKRDVEKAEAKLRQVARRKRQRARRIADMTSEQLAEHRRRSAAVQPLPARERARQTAEASHLMSLPEAPAITDPAAQELAEAIATARAELARRRELEDLGITDLTEGVFS